MGRVNIYFTDNVEEDLKAYVQAEHGSHRALSLTVQKAVKEFLAREEEVEDARSAHRRGKQADQRTKEN